MRASAKFLLKSAMETTRTLSRIFAEQSHRAGGQSLIQVHHVRRHFAIKKDLLIHESLDFGEFVGVHGGVVREVEAQARGLDHAAGLFYMRAKDGAQRGVQQCVPV